MNLRQRGAILKQGDGEQWVHEATDTFLSETDAETAVT